MKLPNSHRGRYGPQDNPAGNNPNPFVECHRCGRLSHLPGMCERCRHDYTLMVRRINGRPFADPPANPDADGGKGVAE
jgi:hypothetical protein